MSGISLSIPEESVLAMKLTPEPMATKFPATAVT